MTMNLYWILYVVQVFLSKIRVRVQEHIYVDIHDLHPCLVSVTVHFSRNE